MRSTLRPGRSIRPRIHASGKPSANDAIVESAACHSVNANTPRVESLVRVSRAWSSCHVPSARSPVPAMATIGQAKNRTRKTAGHGEEAEPGATGHRRVTAARCRSSAG